MNVQNLKVLFYIRINFIAPVHERISPLVYQLQVYRIFFWILFISIVIIPSGLVFKTHSLSGFECNIHFVSKPVTEKPVDKSVVMPFILLFIRRF